MAYTAGVFHIDFVNGSDALRSNLTSCVASNPSGSVTRINKTAHGLVTGAVVDLTLFTAWLNEAWKITVVDANNFDLDGAVWQATADTSGTVRSRGGSDWADAWATIAAGATTARHQPGDEIRIAKTEDPASIGQDATFTDGSNTVTLTTALSKKIEDAISGWTAETNITASTNNSRKIGATALTLTPVAGFTTGKMAYKEIAGGGTQDFSAYQYISFWMRTLSANDTASEYRLCLCSDAIGDTIVNAITLPNRVITSAWQPFNIDFGGALGSNIQSVAIYALVDPGVTAISINNIFAHDGTLDLDSIIGPSADDCYYMIQSVDDTTIKIDSNATNLSGRGWSGSTVTAPLYKRQPFLVYATATFQTIAEAGDSSGGYISYKGGWDTATNIRDGETVFAQQLTGTVAAIISKNWVKISDIVVARFLGMTPFSQNIIERVSIINCASGFAVNALQEVLIKDCQLLNLSSGSNQNGQIVYQNLKYFNNQLSFTIVGLASILSSEFRNNNAASITLSGATNYGTGSLQIRNTVFSDSNDVNITNANLGSFAWSYNHDGTPGNHWGFCFGGTINWQTAVKHGSDPGAWKTSITSVERTALSPITFRVGEITCAAGALVTAKVWMKKDHATDIGCSIFIEDEAYNVDGVVSAETVKANDTSWEQLTLTFTPTVAGVVTLFAKSWFISGSVSDTYTGKVEITQA